MLQIAHEARHSTSATKALIHPETERRDSAQASEFVRHFAPPGGSPETSTQMGETLRGITKPSRRSRDISGLVHRGIPGREWGVLNGSNNNNPAAAVSAAPPACRFDTSHMSVHKRLPLAVALVGLEHITYLDPKGTRCLSLLATTTIKLNLPYASQLLRVPDCRGSGGESGDGFRAMRRGAHRTRAAPFLPIAPRL